MGGLDRHDGREHQASSRRKASRSPETVAAVARGLAGVAPVAGPGTTAGLRAGIALIHDSGLFIVGSMPELRFERPRSTRTLEEWRYVHNVVIPTALLSLEDVRERAGRNHLEVAYLDDTVIGNSTVWPPTDELPVARVIARVLPDQRRRGFGEQIYSRALERARSTAAAVVGTVVLASNTDGLRFAHKHGFVETERYLRPEDEIPWVQLEAALTGVGSISGRAVP